MVDSVLAWHTSRSTSCTAATRRAIGAYLVETDDGLALARLRARQLRARAPRGAARARRGARETSEHLLLSHIHLDHAGAAGVLVREHPGLAVHVSEIGAPHVVDPSRLEASARRLYGDSFDALWGELAPVPGRERPRRRRGGRRARVLPDRRPRLAPCLVPARGRDAVRGRRGGCPRRARPLRVRAARLRPRSTWTRWERTIDELERRAPRRLALTHFGVFEDVERHLGALRETMHDWAGRVGHGMDEPTFVAAARADVAASDPDEADAYDRAASVLALLPRARALLAQAG